MNQKMLIISVFEITRIICTMSIITKKSVHLNELKENTILQSGILQNFKGWLLPARNTSWLLQDKRIACPETVPNYVFMLHYYAGSKPSDLLTIFHLHNLLHLQGPGMDRGYISNTEVIIIWCTT